MNIKENTKIDGFFHVVSRYIIVVPIVFLIVAIFMKYSLGGPSPQRTVNNTIGQVKVNNKYEPQAKPAAPKKTAITKKLDLNGSYLCETASASAVISNKRVRAEYRTGKAANNILFDGDCIYSWQKSAAKGSKSCGFSQYISLYEMFGGGISLDTILPYIESFAALPENDRGSATDEKKAAEFGNSCKPMTIRDPNAFTLPKNVVFTEAK